MMKKNFFPPPPPDPHEFSWLHENLQGPWPHKKRPIPWTPALSPRRGYHVTSPPHKKSLIHPWKLIWNPKMEVWKMIILFNWAVFRFHVKFQGCIPKKERKNTSEKCSAKKKHPGKASSHFGSYSWVVSSNHLLMGTDHCLSGSDDGEMAKCLGIRIWKWETMSHGNPFWGNQALNAKCMIILRDFLLL